MRKDIEIPEAEKIFLAIAKEGRNDWVSYLVNNYNRQLKDAMVVSQGHGIDSGKEVKTSTLRHFVGDVKAHGSSPIERIDPALFHLNHEFWVTFYMEGRIYDKKFFFEAGSLTKKNLSYIKELETKGIITW